MAKLLAKRLGGVLLGVGCGSLAIYGYGRRRREIENAGSVLYVPERYCLDVSREATIGELSADKSIYDIFVIGGGATGSGVAFDAVGRGLRVALVEQGDYGSGTSSRSTKLIHGGVRYLQKAIQSLDYEQYSMVKEALMERSRLVKLAPHLAHPVPILLPIYRYWQVPYFWFGLKLYDIVAHMNGDVLPSSYFANKRLSLELLPSLNPEDLVGSVVYYDAQHNDSMMNVSLLMSAFEMGADSVNYVKAERIDTSNDGRTALVTCFDRISGNRFKVRCRSIVNASGALTDNVRQNLFKSGDLDPICFPSSGTHISLPASYGSQTIGLLDPSTSDGRVVFVLPWQGGIIAGTTDRKCKVNEEMESSSEMDEIDFILSEIQKYLKIKVDRGDVLSAWSGIRPLVVDASKSGGGGETKNIARNHIVEIARVSPTVPLVTIAGGKWTTYRLMAEDAVDAAVKTANLRPARKCQTKTMGIIGSGLMDDDDEILGKIAESDVSDHLVHTYGTRLGDVVALCEIRKDGLFDRIHPDLPYVDGEVRYAVRQQSRHISDVIGLRMRLAFLDCEKARSCVRKIAQIMADELGWTPRVAQREIEEAYEFIDSSMGFRLLSKGNAEPIDGWNEMSFKRISYDTAIRQLQHEFGVCHERANEILNRFRQAKSRISKSQILLAKRELAKGESTQ